MAKKHRFLQTMLAIAALGAAGKCLGVEGWLGINLGSIGIALLYAALWVFVALMPIAVANRVVACSGPVRKPTGCELRRRVPRGVILAC